LLTYVFKAVSLCLCGYSSLYSLTGPTVALARQFKAKAKGAGEDIITPIVEQAATALVETVGK
jgi:hypothetical protein